MPIYQEDAVRVTDHTPEAFRELLDDLGLSQNAAARFLDVGDSRARRWASGKEDIPAYVWILFAVMRENGVSPDEARNLAGFPAYPEPG